jgi:hypothetical protein
MAKVAFTILHQHEFPSTTAARMGKTDVLLVYQTAANVRGSVTLPADDLTDQKIISAVAASLAKGKGLEGRSFEANV